MRHPAPRTVLGLLGALLTLAAGAPRALSAQRGRDIPPSARARLELRDVDAGLGRQNATWRAALSDLLAADAVMPAPGVGFLDGREAILAFFEADSLHRGARVTWFPVRAEASGDGTHGLTAGFLTLTTAAGRVLEYKYLTYWVKGADGWRAQVWRRVPRGAGEVSRRLEPSTAPLAPVPALPPDAHEARRRELQGIERVFSDSAQRIGLGPAFAAFGAKDALHLSGRGEVDFVRGRDAIAANVSQGLAPGTSPVVWSAERTMLAPSGDFGVNLGFITPVASAQRQGPGFPFFTIWRRGADGAWRYIAE